MIGYSGKPLGEKLGIKAGFRVLILNSPAKFREFLEPVPASVKFTSKNDRSADLAIVFSTQRDELSKFLIDLRETLVAEAVIWAAWPKKSAKIQSEITENTIRDIALPLGLVDVKVCAINEVWSGLKLVVRKELR